MKNLKKINYNYIILTVSLILTVTIMAIGYARLSGILELKGNATIKGNWNVSIINIEEDEIIGNAVSISEPTYTNLTAAFDAELKTPGDSIKYKITVQNKGNIEAKLTSFEILPTPNSTDIILYSSENVVLNEVLAPNETKDFYVKVKYNSTTVVSPQSKSILAIIEYVQND